MLIHLVVCLLSFITCQNLYAGAPCFNYEIFEHVAPGGGILPGPNQALINYDYQLIKTRAGLIPGIIPVIPALGPLAHPIGISIMRQAPLPVIPWVHIILPLAGGALAPALASDMAISRSFTGIRVRFAFPAAIVALALGIPLALAVVAAAQRALTSGGYMAPLAAAIYRLRNNIPFPNVSVLPGGFADCIIFHIHNQQRVSKNMKELSYNSRIGILPPLLPPALYMSIKDLINNQFVALAGLLGLPAFPVPHSATVVSSNNLQPD